MSQRFYLEPNVSQVDGTQIILAGDEAHHFIRVMRGNVGDTITLFNGTQTYYEAVVQEIRKNVLLAKIVQTLEDEIESPLHLTACVALPKGDRQKVLVEKLAELGVARFVPLRTERSVAKADTNVLLRLKRQVIEASKQCGRNVLMQMTEELTISQVAALLTPNDLRLLLHSVALGAVNPLRAGELVSRSLPKGVAFLVGPEGSFTEAEVSEAIALGFQPLDLGRRILRTETAAIAAAALLLTTDVRA